MTITVTPDAIDLTVDADGIVVTVEPAVTEIVVSAGGGGGAGTVQSVAGVDPDGTADIPAASLKTALDLSGTNTGDQDLSGLATTSALSSEASTRATADTTNANAISAEATARANADTALDTAAQGYAAAAQAYAVARSHHTGTQTASTISDFSTAVAALLGAYATSASVAAGYQPLDSDLTAIAALSTTSFGRSVLTQADAAALRTLAGLGNVDNTADTAKPVSTAQQTALDAKVAKTGDTMTGQLNLQQGSSTTPILDVTGSSAGTVATIAIVRDHLGNGIWVLNDVGGVTQTDRFALVNSFAASSQYLAAHYRNSGGSGAILANSDVIALALGYAAVAWTNDPVGATKLLGNYLAPGCFIFNGTITAGSPTITINSWITPASGADATTIPANQALTVVANTGVSAATIAAGTTISGHPTSTTLTMSANAGGTGTTTCTFTVFAHTIDVHAMQGLRLHGDNGGGTTGFATLLRNSSGLMVDPDNDGDGWTFSGDNLLAPSAGVGSIGATGARIDTLYAGTVNSTNLTGVAHIGNSGAHVTDAYIDTINTTTVVAGGSVSATNSVTGTSLFATGQIGSNLTPVPTSYLTSIIGSDLVSHPVATSVGPAVPTALANHNVGMHPLGIAG